MFTGIIEEIGAITKITQRNSGLQLEVRAKKILDDLKIDDSVAVDGICLTVTSIDATSMVMDASSETISKTTLIHLKRDQRVNLERALRLNDRLGGHIVQGHVDGTGRANVSSIGDWLFKIPYEFSKYIIVKGSIAINGVSLTVAEKSGDQIRIAMIPHTLSSTTFQFLHEGDAVNIELDFFAKYVEQLLSKSSLTEEWLREKGFE